MARIQPIGVKCSALIFLDHPRPEEPRPPPPAAKGAALPGSSGHPTGPSRLGKDSERPLGKETGIHNSVVSEKVGFPGSEHPGLGCLYNKMLAAGSAQERRKC